MSEWVVRAQDWAVSMSVLLACNGLVGYPRFVAKMVAVKNSYAENEQFFPRVC